MKETRPIRVTIMRNNKGQTHVQVSVQSPDGSIYRGPYRNIENTSLASAVDLALSKALGHEEATEESGPIPD